MKNKKTFILDIEPDQLSKHLKTFVEQEYRVNQIKDWIYIRKRKLWHALKTIRKKASIKMKER